MEEGCTRETERTGLEMLDFRCEYGYCNFQYPAGFKDSDYKFLSCRNAQVEENAKPLRIKCKWLNEPCPPFHGII